MTERTIRLFLNRITGAGGSRVTVRMANELAGRGHRVRVAVRRPTWKESLRGRLRPAFSWEGALRVPVERYGETGELPLAPGDVAVAVGSHTVATVAGLAAPGLTRLAWCHGFLGHQPEHMQAAWSTELPKIAVSPTLVETLESYGGGPCIGVVPNGLDPEEYFVEPGVERAGVGLIYRDHWTKDPEFTLRVVAALRERRPDLPVHAFGFGRRPAALGPATYERTPPVARARALYNRARVWMVTSRAEGFCLPILEAMACGAAVVTTAHMSAPGLVEDGESGWIVPIGDLDGYVERVLGLLDDAGTRARFVAAGEATVARFTWSAAAEAMESCLGLVAASS